MTQLLRSLTLLAALAVAAPALAQTLHGTLYKSPDCPCCEGHAAYLRENGIELDIKPVENIALFSREAGIPSAYLGCHTILLDGYVIEGHVSIELIEKLLSQRPADVVGITLPGMPTGVPGMEGPKTQPYEVYAIKKDGAASVFGFQ